MRYHVELPLIALAFRDDHYAAVTIPVGKVLNVVGQGEDARFLVVEVEGERLQVFETDLASHCTAHAERNRPGLAAGGGA